MRQVVILSGKGGTGKTTVTAALAHLASQNGSVILVDADVDAPNLELLLQPRTISNGPFFAGKKATIDASLCNACRQCEEVCRYGAIARCVKVYRVAPLDCEGCASCFYTCPTGAIRMQDHLAGYCFRSDTRFGSLFHARLLPGAENSGKMVSALRQDALALAQEQGADWVMIDGAPGIGCPVIAAVTGADMALIISEPTVSGVHDLKRALQVCEHFGVSAAVGINKADINPSKADEISRYCTQHDMQVIARIRYDNIVTDAMQRGCAVTELGENAVAREISLLWLALCDRVQEP